MGSGDGGRGRLSLFGRGVTNYIHLTGELDRAERFLTRSFEEKLEMEPRESLLKRGTIKHGHTGKGTSMPTFLRRMFSKETLAKMDLDTYKRICHEQRLHRRVFNGQNLASKEHTLLAREFRRTPPKRMFNKQNPVEVFCLSLTRNLSNGAV